MKFFCLSAILALAGLVAASPAALDKRIPCVSCICPGNGKHLCWRYPARETHATAGTVNAGFVCNEAQLAAGCETLWDVC